MHVFFLASRSNTFCWWPLGLLLCHTLQWDSESWH